MLKQSNVAAEVERLRVRAAALPDTKRHVFYKRLSAELKDPDTYAALNWFFVVGLHHFYLRHYLQGLLTILAFALGVALLFTSIWLTGIVLLLAITVYECYQLFQAQLIVQAWNNRLMQRLLDSADYSTPSDNNP